MAFIPFPEYRPDVNDYQGQHTQVMSGVLPRGDGWGPFPNLQAYTQALPAACRGFFYGRKTDGSITVFAATANRLFQLNNSNLTWTPVSRVNSFTVNISTPSAATFTLNAHGLSVDDQVVFSTTGALPTGIVAGTIYYVLAAGLTTNTFEVSTTSGGTAVVTSGTQSGTHSFTYFYSSVPSTDHWQFAQFGDVIIAVQGNTTPQAFTLSSSAAFADLGGSPPFAKNVAVVGRFLVLSGLTSNLRRVQWSDLDGITTWTAGVGFSNYVDLPDGGVVRAVAGGEFGLVFQESVIRRLTYVSGAKPAFQIERITEDKGLLGTYSVCRAGENIFFVAPEGFFQYAPGQGLISIGKEKVDRTFRADLDNASTNLLIGGADPSGTRVYWAYKSVRSSNTAAFDTLIAFDYALQRWSPQIAVSGEYLSSLIKPGLTLEGLDTISSSIDALTFSLDSVQAAIVSKLAAVDSSHKMGFFDGANVEAALETPEQALGEGHRVFVRGMYPRTDAPTVYGSLRCRQNAQGALVQTVETIVDAQGCCPQLKDTRLARARVRIPVGTLWTYCMGVEPDFVPAGRR